MTTPTVSLPREQSSIRQDLVLIDRNRPQGLRTHRGERLDQVFEERCDWMRHHGRAGALAVDDEDIRLTFDELDARANQLARHLVARGTRPGDRVALLVDQAVYAYLGMLAVLKVQAAYVPLDAGFPADRIAYILGDAEVRTVLTVTTVRERLPEVDSLDAELVFADAEAEAIDRLPAHRLGPAERGTPTDDLAYIIYTSGSTGRPKGVAIDHPSICNFVRVAGEVYGLRATDRMYQGLTIAFDFSVEEIWVSWVAGATLVPKPRGASLLGHELHEFLTRRGVTAMACVPTLLATIEDELPRLRFLLVSGEACPQDLIARWWSPGRRFLNVYGPTEATVTATWTELHPAKAVTIGIPLPTYSTVVLDPDDPTRALPHGEVGEIGIAGIGLARGYLNNPEKTEKAFIPDFLGIPGNPSGRIYRTGDLGRVNADGEIEYSGRIDLQVKIRGYRIELTEIESVLLEFPGIAAAVVDTWEPTEGQVELVGYYSLRSDTPSVDEDRLTAALRERLPGYMVPAYLEHLDAIPMTTSDKADRKALPAPRARHGSAPAGEHVEAGTELERTLAGLLARALGLEKVSVTANVFDELGANSLVMTKFSARVRELGSTISIKDIYANPSVRELARFLGDTGAAPAGPGAPAARPVRPAPAPRTGTVVRGSRVGHALVGVAQLLLALATLLGVTYVLEQGMVRVAGGADAVAVLTRGAEFTSALFLASCLLPVAAKWLLIGRWRPGRTRLWSAGHLRVWIVRTLAGLSPLARPGSPLMNIHLRLMGARVGRGAVVLSRTLPVATDLITIGRDALVEREVSYTGHRAVAGHLEFGPVTIGDGAVVAAKCVLDIGTAVGDRARLDHASSLHQGQYVPAGVRWHGSPAQPAGIEQPTASRAPSRVRPVVYGLLQVLLALVGSVVAVSGAVLVFRAVPSLGGLFDPSGAYLRNPLFYGLVAALAVGVFALAVVMGLAVHVTLPRLLQRLVPPGVDHPMYGFRRVVQGSVTRLGNSRFFMMLFGDSSAATTYLRALGWKMPGLQQTGSNFGTELRQDAPTLCTVGTGTMVSDGLSVKNVAHTVGAFRVSPVTLGAQTFLGNEISLPAGARIGDNVLLGTKVAVPTDGTPRHDVGLLGSPAFEIPRSVSRDAQFDLDALRVQRLGAKNRHNAAGMLLFLTARAVQTVAVVLLLAVTLALWSSYGVAALVAGSAATSLAAMVLPVLAERVALGFGRLQPQFCSIYDRVFWRQERLWKLLAYPALAGTPFRTLLWRALGVRVGKRLYDDGAGIPEKTLVALGDDVVLNAGAIVQCHSLEDGTFKSDRTELGDGVVVGVGAFVHYGVVMGDGSSLAVDAFLMKGEEVAPFARWQGNPASEVRPVAPAPRPVPGVEPTVVLSLEAPTFAFLASAVAGPAGRHPYGRPVPAGPARGPALPAPRVPAARMPVPRMPAPRVPAPRVPAPRVPAPRVPVPRFPAPQGPGRPMRPHPAAGRPVPAAAVRPAPPAAPPHSMAHPSVSPRPMAHPSVPPRPIAHPSVPPRPIAADPAPWRPAPVTATPARPVPATTGPSGPRRGPDPGADGVHPRRTASREPAASDGPRPAGTASSGVNSREGDHPTCTVGSAPAHPRARPIVAADPDEQASPQVRTPDRSTTRRSPPWTRPSPPSPRRPPRRPCATPPRRTSPPRCPGPAPRSCSRDSGRGNPTRAPIHATSRSPSPRARAAGCATSTATSSSTSSPGPGCSPSATTTPSWSRPPASR